MTPATDGRSCRGAKAYMQSSSLLFNFRTRISASSRSHLSLPWKKIPAAAIRRNRRPESPAIIRSPGADLQIANRNAFAPQCNRANGGNADEAADLHHEYHGERLLLGHAEQTEREDGTDDESAGEPREMGEDHDEAEEYDEEEVIEWPQQDPESEACEQEMRRRDQLDHNARQHHGKAPPPRGGPYDAFGE